MSSITVRVKRLTPTAHVPRQATSGSAGFDVYSDNTTCVIIGPHQSVRIPTGISAELPENHVMLLFARSGLATKHGINLTNGVGVIDSDYTGEIGALLHNSSDIPFIVNPGTRVMQAIVFPYPAVEYIEVDELSDTERGAGGFGSTGV